MIALAILGMGLLVIGAALPVGLRYTRESVNIATGQAAAEYALDLIEQNVCLPRAILDTTIDPSPVVREPGLFVPRDVASGDFDPNYEPVIKVHPLYVRSIDATPGSGILGQEYTPPLDDWVEQAIYNELPNLGIVPDPNECDYNAWLRPALPSVAQVYPPVTPDTPFSQVDFFTSMYAPRPVRSLATPIQGAETRKVLDSQISWTAFYRRVSYDDPSTVGINEGDPTLYEFIAVAVRRPSLRHRFPVQDPSNGSDGSFAGVDTPVPVSWLLTFNDPLPMPMGGFDAPTGCPLDAAGQPLGLNGPVPATIAFTCNAGFSGLFPVGSILIPARNDVAPSVLIGAVPIDFGPKAPTTLPIYEVVQRPNDITVVVKFNAYYPRQGNARPPGSQWPVWVIPPAYEEGTSLNPVLPDRSPIVAVARRYVRLREIP